MIAAVALLIQAAAPAAGESAPARPAPALKALDVARAIDTFKATCWTHFRDPADLRAAILAAPLPLSEASASGGPAETWRADDAVLSYAASDDLPATVPSRQCSLRTRLASPADQLALAARIEAALAVRGGATRTAPTGAQTSWDVRQPDGRIARLIVSTTNAAGGATDLRQILLLLAPR